MNGCKLFLKGITAACIILVVSLTGCSSPSATKPIAPSAAPLAVEMMCQVSEDQYFDSEWGLLVEAQAIIPVIKNPENQQGISAINKDLSERAGAFWQFVNTKGVQIAKEDKQYAREVGYAFRPHEYVQESSVAYNGNNLLSIFFLHYENTGGAHPNAFWSSVTYDVSTGSRMALEDILAGSKEEVLNKVYQYVTAEAEKRIQNSEVSLYESYQEDIRTTFSEDDFMLTENSMLIYYQPYALAPYAAGALTFEIPYHQEEMFARVIPSLPVDQSAELYTQALRLLNNNKIAVFDIFYLSMLELELPEEGIQDEMIFPVKDQHFTTYAELESFVRGTYAKKEADNLLNSGRYLAKDGRLHGDLSQDGGIGYYVDWGHYTFEITDITQKEAVLKIYTIEDSPAGREEITISVKLIKQNDLWLLENMVY